MTIIVSVIPFYHTLINNFGVLKFTNLVFANWQFITMWNYEKYFLNVYYGAPMILGSAKF